MRELKFRAWSRSVEKYLYMDDVWFLSDEQKHYESVGEKFFRQVNKVGDCTLEQFTGLYDKNGTEIYEGDIVENTNSGGCKESGRLPVEMMYAVWFPFGNHDCSWDSDECEVVGNVHEHPELLKGVDESK